MAAAPLSTSILQQAVNALADAGGNATHAATKLKIPRGTLQARIRAAAIHGITAGIPTPDLADPQVMQAEIKRLRTEITSRDQARFDEEMIRSQIVKLHRSVTTVEPPDWTIDTARAPSAPGVPTLFCSDWHVGETVHPSQINGVNVYNIKVYRERLKTLAQSTIDLLRIISPKLNYPGIVMPLGGDMISGNIHEELTATNELNSMDSVLELYGSLVWMITLMADTFGKVFLPCVTGNHGRDTKKIWGKDRHKTSFDWLLYCFLAKHFEGDKRVTFQIPDGPDAYYRIYQHKYLLTHGDQFRGGDGMIGALGPIIRGDHRKRSRNAQIDMSYDTMLLGHWHQYINLNRLIVNGSLKGYDEYAYSNNFGFEAPVQALWLTHPKHRITFRMPVHVDKMREPAKTAWASVGT